MAGFRELIAGSDGSERGRDALALARMLARALGVPLSVVRFVESEGAAAAVNEDVSAIVAESAVKGFEKLVAHRPGAMIVLGSTERAGIQRVFPGSVAERLLQTGRCAVAIAPRGFAGEPSAEEDIRVIAVGFDGRAPSRAALGAAAELGMHARATLRVIAVRDTAGQAHLPPPPPPAPGESLDDQLHAAVRELPSELRALPVFARGNPFSILWEKGREGVDLLVLGAGDQGPLLRAWLSDPGTALMRSAPCPVLLIRAGLPAGS